MEASRRPEQTTAPGPSWATYSLLDALIHRRSRRFGQGMHLDGGPLQYQSRRAAQPLTVEEEAALAFAACGITGHALAELPFESGAAEESGSGNIMIHLTGRTVASGDAVHCVMVFVLNDDGVWMLKRPQDFPRAEIAGLAEAARARRFADLYAKSRVRIAEERLDVPRQLPFVPAFNKWSANLPGTTYFLPVAELSAFYINILLTAFSEEFGYYLVDDHNSYKPAGIGSFARSRGGHLHDDPAAGRFAPVSLLESWLYEFAALEQGGMLQNLGLMTQALGLGGFAHFAAHPFIWMQTLGFRMAELPLARTIGAGPVMKLLLRLLKKDVPVPTAIGLERDGAVLVKPYCPPYYRTMEEAVLAFVAYKFGKNTGTFRDGGTASAWRDGAAVQAGVPAYSERAVAATIAYCEYLYGRYGRFPAGSGPFRSVLAYQAHRLDLDFYDTFYKPGAYTATQQPS